MQPSQRKVIATAKAISSRVLASMCFDVALAAESTAYALTISGLAVEISLTRRSPDRGRRSSPSSFLLLHVADEFLPQAKTGVKPNQLPQKAREHRAPLWLGVRFHSLPTQVGVGFLSA